MNVEELKKELDGIERDYRDQCETLRIEKNKNKQKVLNQWAKEHKRFCVGDILVSGNIIIKVESYRGKYSDYYQDKAYVEYYGARLTKKGLPMKDGSKTMIYDDGREVNYFGNTKV